MQCGTAGAYREVRVEWMFYRHCWWVCLTFRSIVCNYSVLISMCISIYIHICIYINICSSIYIYIYVIVYLYRLASRSGGAGEKCLCILALALIVLVLDGFAASAGVGCCGRFAASVGGVVFLAQM